jgi:putative tricarboxylic transport membrane protein
VAVVLTLCGAWIVWEARTGGFRQMDEPSGDAAYWPAFIWVSAGLLANAALITAIGFILSCTLCYVLAVQGLRRAAGQAGANSPRAWATDVFTGAVISAPVYWMFTQFLGINLPGLTSTGWL